MKVFAWVGSDHASIKPGLAECQQIRMGGAKSESVTPSFSAAHMML
jgi:hypothetical protein